MFPYYAMALCLCLILLLVGPDVYLFLRDIYGADPDYFDDADRDYAETVTRSTLSNVVRMDERPRRIKP